MSATPMAPERSDADDASRWLAEQSLESPLGSLPRQALVSVGDGATLLEALTLMQQSRVGSVLVLDAAGAARGILTRHDILDRITLPQRPLTTPLDEVMSAPVHTLDQDASAQDAVLLMARHGIRHVPVTAQGRVVGMVSQRDLFALQRLSISQLSAAIRAADRVDSLPALAGDIRQLARNLLRQGLRARELTALISRLNDLLTARLVHLVAQAQRVDLDQACWLAFGSEGRSEQTISTDQDNGLVFASDQPEVDRPRWLAFANEVNQRLDACGYPLCKGNVMASNPACCLSRDEWLARFAHWIEHGAPQDLLSASIFFDLRPLAGCFELAQPLREQIATRAARVPRFIKQLADNALLNGSPLTWLGDIDVHKEDGRRLVDLKLHGTMIFVDAARLYALANGIAETNTRVRFEAIARAMGVPAAQAQAWTAGFEFLQLLRLQVQVEQGGATHNPNELELGRLNDVDRRMLRESLRVARRLQQRMALDYQR